MKLLKEIVESVEQWKLEEENGEGYITNFYGNMMTSQDIRNTENYIGKELEQLEFDEYGIRVVVSDGQGGKTKHLGMNKPESILSLLTWLRDGKFEVDFNSGENYTNKELSTLNVGEYAPQIVIYAGNGTKTKHLSLSNPITIKLLVGFFEKKYTDVKNSEQTEFVESVEGGVNKSKEVWDFIKAKAPDNFKKWYIENGDTSASWGDGTFDNMTVKEIVKYFKDHFHVDNLMGGFY